MKLPPIDFTLTFADYERVVEEGIAGYKLAVAMIDEDLASDKSEFARRIRDDGVPRTPANTRRAKEVRDWLRQRRAKREVVIARAQRLWDWSQQASTFLRAQFNAEGPEDGNARLAAILQPLEELNKVVGREVSQDDGA